jgi:hypothetical protein
LRSVGSALHGIDGAPRLVQTLEHRDTIEGIPRAMHGTAFGARLSTRDWVSNRTPWTAFDLLDSMRESVMEDENGPWEADRRIRDHTEGNTDPAPGPGDAARESSAGLERLWALIKELTADGTQQIRATASDASSPSVRQRTTEVIVGWRAWRLVTWKLWKPQYEVQLESIVYPMFWHPAKPVQGKVGLGLPSGVHAWQTHAQCLEHKELYGSYARDWLIGEVSLWGHVIKHEHGYRAQFAYPRRLIVPECLRERGDIVADLRRTYGVECEWG